MADFSPYFTLPLPDGAQPLHLTLSLVDTLEQTGGSLYAVAEKLVARQMLLGDVVRMLMAAYKHSGCRMDDAAIQGFLMRCQPAVLLTRLLSAVLSPLATVDIAQDITPGEAAPANAG